MVVDRYVVDHGRRSLTMRQVGLALAIGGTPGFCPATRTE